MKWRQVTSHDLWQSQSLPRSLSAARRVMMVLPPSSGIMTSPKYLPTIKEGNKASGTIYMNLHTKRKVSLLYLKKANWLISLSMADKTIGGYVRTPCPDAFCRCDWIKNLYRLRSYVHPFGNYMDHQGREASTGFSQTFMVWLLCLVMCYIIMASFNVLCCWSVVTRILRKI